MASPNISFEQIPASLRKPGKYFEFNTKLAVRTLATNHQKMLILAPAATAEGIFDPVPVFEDQTVATLCGAGSIGHLMARAAMTANPYLDLTVLPVAPADAALAATATLTISGDCTGSGVVTLTVANTPVQVAAMTGQTAKEVAEALARVIGQTTDLPVSAGVAVNEDNPRVVLTLTSKTPGAVGNSLVVTATSTAYGLTLTLTTMTGGQTNPDLADSLVKVFGTRYDVIASPFDDTDSLRSLRSHLEAVSNPLEQREGIAALGATAPMGAEIAKATALNSGWMSVAHLPGTASPAALIAAAYGALIAGEEDPARPLNGLELKGIAVPPVPARLGRNEQETLLRSGITPLEVGPGDRVQIVRAITTYTKNPVGADDIALLDVTTPRTLAYVRRAIKERIDLRFPREKLSARTPAKVRSEILDVLTKAEELEIVEAVEANKAGVICERDSQDPSRLNACVPVDVVNGLHIFAGRIDLLL